MITELIRFDVKDDLGKGPQVLGLITNCRCISSVVVINGLSRVTVGGSIYHPNGKYQRNTSLSRCIE